MRLKYHKVAVMVLLAACVSLAGCPRDTYRKVLEAENGVAQSIGAGADIVASLYCPARRDVVGVVDVNGNPVKECVEGVIDRDEKNALTLALLDANALLNQFNKGAKSVHAAGYNQTAYLALAESLSQGVRALNSEGRLRIKNEQARARVDAVFASIDAAIAILKNAIQGETK